MQNGKTSKLHYRARKILSNDMNLNQKYSCPKELLIVLFLVSFSAQNNFFKKDFFVSLNGDNRNDQSFKQ